MGGWVLYFYKLYLKRALLQRYIIQLESPTLSVSGQYFASTTPALFASHIALIYLIPVRGNIFHSTSQQIDCKYLLLTIYYVGVQGHVHSGTNTRIILHDLISF